MFSQFAERSHDQFSENFLFGASQPRGEGGRHSPAQSFIPVGRLTLMYGRAAITEARLHASIFDFFSTAAMTRADSLAV
jgi:hypothetical protein